MYREYRIYSWLVHKTCIFYCNVMIYYRQHTFIFSRMMKSGFFLCLNIENGLSPLSNIFMLVLSRAFIKISSNKKSH